MKLAKILLFAAIMTGFHANASTTPSANCAAGDKTALVKNKNRDLRVADMVMGTQAPAKTNKPRPSSTTAIN